MYQSKLWDCGWVIINYVPATTLEKDRHPFRATSPSHHSGLRSRGIRTDVSTMLIELPALFANKCQ